MQVPDMSLLAFTSYMCFDYASMLGVSPVSCQRVGAKSGKLGAFRNKSVSCCARRCDRLERVSRSSLSRYAHEICGVCSRLMRHHSLHYTGPSCLCPAVQIIDLQRSAQRTKARHHELGLSTSALALSIHCTAQHHLLASTTAI